MPPLTATARPSSASRKRHAAGALLPPTVGWLESLALSMHVDTAAPLASPSRPARRQRHATHYTLTLERKQHPLAAVTTRWTLRRSLKDYTAFQKRLLARMQHGHFCGAACPWLFTFIKSYFPKQSLFRTRPCARLAQRRCDALLRCFAALQTFVLNRANHSCAVVVDHIAAELLQFVLEDAGPDHPLKRASQWTHRASSSGAGRFSSGSVASTSDDDSSSSAADTESAMCDLCDCSLESAAHSSSSGRSPALSVVEASGARTATTLSCGHAFHDECIVPKLNDAMQCPTCGTAQSSG